MAVLSCPHCGTVHIVVGGEPDTEVCTQIHCRRIMKRLVEPDAGAAVRKAFYAHDHNWYDAGDEFDGKPESLPKAVTVTADTP